MSVEVSAEEPEVEVLYPCSCNETAEGFPVDIVSYSVEVGPGLSAALSFSLDIRGV